MKIIFKNTENVVISLTIPLQKRCLKSINSMAVFVLNNPLLIQISFLGRQVSMAHYNVWP